MSKINAAIVGSLVIVILAFSFSGCASLPFWKPSPEKLSFLNDRLFITMPAGGRTEDQGFSTQYEQKPDERSMRATWERGGKKIVVQVREEFAYSHDRIENEVRNIAEQWNKGGKNAYSVEQVQSVGGLRIFQIVPAHLIVSHGDALLCKAYVENFDKTILLVTIDGDAQATDNTAEYTGLAGDIIRSIAPGTRALKIAGGDTWLGRIPKDHVATLTDGPDFTVSWVNRVVPFGQAGAELGIYFGAYPQHRSAQAKNQVEKIKTTLYGKKATWLLLRPTKDDPRFSLETIIYFWRAGIKHIFISAGSEEHLLELKAIVDEDGKTSQLSQTAKQDMGTKCEAPHYDEDEQAPNVRGSVLEREAAMLTLKMEQMEGVKEGMCFFAVKEGRVIHHPKTGEVLDVESSELGRIKITEVRQDTAVGMIMKEYQPNAIQSGTLIRGIQSWRRKGTL